MPKVGVWFIGASGSVATTAMAGSVALAKRKAGPVGLVTELPEFRKAKFCKFDSLVFGGHEVRKPNLLGEVKALHKSSGLLSPEIIGLAARSFPAIQRRIRPGVAAGCGKPVDEMTTLKLIGGKRPADIVKKIRRDFEEFKKRTKCDKLVVVNLQSTEPPFKRRACHKLLDKLRVALAKPGPSPLPASSLYCMAALEMGAAYVNFTPGLGPDVPAFVELAEETGGLLAGSDGKTGETLCKSVIAPLFVMRNLKVMSWVGHNILGNRDGLILDDPRNKASKLKSKDHLINDIVGYPVKTLVTIENIESMGDWKTAWDHIHFEGFLGTKMVMQFIWEGCDSILAAALVLDLIRLAALAQDRGESGIMKHTACFFKSPLGTSEQDMFKQFQMLAEHLKG